MGTDKVDVTMSDRNGGTDHETTKSDRKLSDESRNILFYTHIVVGVCQACFFIYASLLPYLSKQYGMDTVTFGYMMSGAALVQLVLGPVIGRYGDKYGARAVLVLSAVSTMFGHVTLGFASSTPMIIFSRLTTVVQDTRTGAQMMVTNLASGPERGVQMGKLALPMSLGMFLGPAVAGQMAKYLGMQQSLLITWLAPLTCVFVLYTFVPRDTKTDQSETGTSSQGDAGARPSVFALMKQKSVLILMAMKIMSALPAMTFVQNLGIIGMTSFGLTPQGNGLILSFSGVIGIVNSAFVLGWLTRRYTEDQILKAATILMIAGYAILSQTYAVWMLPLLLLPWGLGNVILDNQIVSRLTKCAPAGQTGAMVGLNASVFQLARIVAPLLGGYLIQNLGFQSIGYFGLLVSLCLSGLVFSALPKQKTQ